MPPVVDITEPLLELLRAAGVEPTMCVEFQVRPGATWRDPYQLRARVYVPDDDGDPLIRDGEPVLEWREIPVAITHAAVN